jgi:hypothetical protein
MGSTSREQPSITHIIRHKNMNSQNSETKVMLFLFNLLRITGLYMFRALLAHPQEALHKLHLVYCVRIMSVGCTRIEVFHFNHNMHAIYQVLPEDEQVMLETCKVKVPRNRPEGPVWGRGIALLFIDLGTRRGWVVSTTPRPLYTRERPGTHCTGGWVGPRAGLDVCEKSRPDRDSTLGPSSP